MRKIDNEKSMSDFRQVSLPRRRDNQIGLDGRTRWVKSRESNYSDNGR